MQELTKRGVGLLLKDKIVAQYRYFASAGEISMEDRTGFSALWATYHDMGMNTLADSLNEHVMSLPIAKPDSKE